MIIHGTIDAHLFVRDVVLSCVWFHTEIVTFDLMEFKLRASISSKYLYNFKWNNPSKLHFQYVAECTDFFAYKCSCEVQLTLRCTTIFQSPSGGWSESCKSP